MTRRLFQIPAFKNQSNITPFQGMILAFVIDKEEDIFQKDIEQMFSLSRSTVSGILSTMEKNELIIRERVDADARLRKISPTEQGRKLHSLFKSELAAIEYQVVAGLTDNEITAFLQTAEKIKRNLLK